MGHGTVDTGQADHVVLTGAPGTAETSVLAALLDDVRTVPEPARRVLTTHRAGPVSTTAGAGPVAGTRSWTCVGIVAVVVTGCRRAPDRTALEPTAASVGGVHVARAGSGFAAARDHAVSDLGSRT